MVNLDQYINIHSNNSIYNTQDIFLKKRNNANLTELTVCLLTYNHAHLLSEVIENISNQTYNDFHLFISDDCSTDNSWDVILDCAKNDNRIVPFKTPNNLGMAGNVNYIFSYVKTKYFAILHHDDIVDKNLFNDWLEVIRKSEDIGFVFNDYITEKYKGIHKYYSLKLDEIMDGKYLLKKYLMKKKGSVVWGTALIRTKFFKKIGGLNEKFGLVADVDLWMRLSAKWKVGYVNKPLITIVHDRSNSYPVGYTKFNWKRKSHIYNILSENLNRKIYKNLFFYYLKRMILRIRISNDILMWMIYGIIKNKKEIIIESSDIQTSMEMFYSYLFRKLLIYIYD